MNERLNPYTHTPAGAPTHPLPSGRPNAPYAPLLRAPLPTPPAYAPPFATLRTPPHTLDILYNVRVISSEV